MNYQCIWFVNFRNIYLIFHRENILKDQISVPGPDTPCLELHWKPGEGSEEHAAIMGALMNKVLFIVLSHFFRVPW